MHSLFELQSFVCCRDASLRVSLPPRFLHNCRQSNRHKETEATGQRGHVTTCADTSRRCASRPLTGVCRPEVVRVAGEEGLVVLRRQVHVIIRERLATRHPRIPEQQHGRNVGTSRRHMMMAERGCQTSVRESLAVFMSWELVLGWDWSQLRAGAERVG